MTRIEQFLKEIKKSLFILVALGLRCYAWAFSSVWASLVQPRAHRLRSRGTWAELLHGMWNRPRPGFKPVSPALTGEFLSTAPSGNSRIEQFLKHILHKGDVNDQFYKYSHEM